MEKYYNLTIPQENIWLLEKNNPNSNINNIFGTFRINKKLDLEILNKVINKIVECNDALRIRIVEENNIPKQFISKFEHQTFEKCLLSDNDDKEINKIIQKISKQRLEILNSKLYDIKIVQNEVETCVCVKTHHIISDAWTLGQIAEQIKDNYLKFSNDEEIEIKPSYIDFINNDKKYRGSEKYISDKQYWDDYVKELQCLNKYEIVSNKQSNRIQKSIDLELYEQINKYCSDNKVSEYTFFLAIISIYFSRVFNEQEIVIGTPFLNRKKANKELDMMGMFIATLPINIKTKLNMSFLEICKEINNTNMQCFRHSKYPYYEIQKAYQDYKKEKVNLYEIAFSYQVNKLEKEIENDTGTTTWIHNGTQANPLLISYVNHFGEHLLYYDYLIECINNDDVSNIHERIRAIIEQVLQNEQIKIDDISILSKKDFKLIKEFNDTGIVKQTEETIISRFEKIVSDKGNKVAIVCGNSKITYAELNDKAEELCIKIKSENLYNEAIPIILDNDISFIISILGVLKSNNYYIPILPEESNERMLYIIEDSKARLIITNNKYINQINNNIDKIDINNFKINDNGNEKVKTLSNDIAYLIYTSGTTGNPKGVIMKNENIMSLINAMNKDKDLEYLGNDVAISLLKHSFDASAIDIYSTLLNGGKLVLIPKENEFDANYVVEVINSEGVTRFFSVHKWIDQIQDVSIKNNIYFCNLRLIGTGAEVLKPKRFENLLIRNPNINIYNTYGPTETTMFITKHKVTEKDIEEDISPIGKLIPTTRAVILDKNNKLLPINAKGELAVYEDCNSAKNIAKGYFNKEKLTKDKFIKIYNPITNEENIFYKTGDIAKINNNLELEFIGREDDFVKVFGGYLVSLNEVEQKIKQLLGKDIECSIIVSNIKQTNNLILFISKNNENKNIKNEDIKELIDSKITFYMRPKYIFELDEIPRNKNGKVDRRKLESIVKENIISKDINIKPQTVLEQMIYDRFRKVINDEFSVTDDLVDDLNLDSLNMTQLYIALGNDKITIQDLYNYSNIRDLANMLKSEIIEKIEENSKPIKIKNNSKQFNLESVLLTGVTGFVGVNLLKELAENNKVKKIYCIVRNKINVSSEERFIKNIEMYFDRDTCNMIREKTIVINGDLTKENLGTTFDEFNKITSEVTTVINCAANVKHIGKYSNFYRDNVQTIINLLNICKENHISLAHVSTLSLHGFKNNNVDSIFDENTLNINQTFDKSPYLISKFEAEKIILESIIENNINAKILRIGNIMPRISDGVFQSNFEQNAFMLAIKEFGNIGLNVTEIMDKEIYLTPVDECAKAINIILNSNYSNTIYHIESDKIVKVADIIKIIKRKHTELNTTNISELKEKLYENYNVGVEHLKAIINQNTNKYSKEETMNVLKELNFKWSNIDEQYLKNIVNIAFKIK